MKACLCACQTRLDETRGSRGLVCSPHPTVPHTDRVTQSGLLSVGLRWWTRAGLPPAAKAACRGHRTVHLHSQPALEGSVQWAVAPDWRAGPGQAQAMLSLQLAEAVLVGHPGGRAQPTGGRAGAPGRAPFWARDARGWRDKAGNLASWG